MGANDYITNRDLEYFKKTLELTYLKKTDVYSNEELEDIFLKKEELVSAMVHDHKPATYGSDGFLTKADKLKLDMIESGANNYTHPDTHPASMIEQDSEHRFVTDGFIEMVKSDNKCRILECSNDEYNFWLRIGMIDLNTLYMITGESEGKQVITGIYFANKPYLGGYLPRYIPVERVVLDKTHFDVEAGSETWIGASVYPSNSSFRMLDYEIEDESIATIDIYGKITAHKKGYTKVTIRSQDNSSAYVNIAILVNDPIVKDMNILSKNVLITAGYSDSLSFEVVPAIASNKIHWRTSDRDIAVVDFRGKVFGLNPGTCTITGITTDGSAIKDKIKVKIIENIIEAKELIIEDFDNEIFLDEVNTIQYTIVPKNASEKNIKLTSSNEDILKVNNNDFTFIGVSIGSAILTVETIDGSNIKESYKINVRKKEIKVKKITINEVGNKRVGDIFSISYNITPYNADDTRVIYSVICTNQVEYTQDGRFIALNPGKARLRVNSLIDPSIYAETTIEITKKVESTIVERLELEFDALVLNKDELGTHSTTIDVTVYPIREDNKDVYWKSSNDSIVSVDYEGNIVAKNYGSAIVTCYSLHSGLTASCEVKVTGNNIPVTTVKILTESSKKIKISERYRLPVTVLPIDAANRDVTYSSTDTTIAYVTSEGYICGLTVGKCNIIATSVSDPSKSAKCEVTVVQDYDDILVTDIRIANAVFDIKSKETIKLIAIPLPVNATNQELIWSSSNNNIAIVEKDGTVIGKSEGSCKIRAYNRASGVESVVTITVLSEGYSGSGISSITIDGSYASKYKPYSTFTQDFNVVPYSAKDNLNPLAVTSDFPHIAGISGETIVCGSNKGFTVIRTEFADNITTYLQLFVTDNLQINSFKCTSDIVNVIVGKTAKLKFVYDPVDFPFDYSCLTYKIIKDNEDDEDIIEINEEDGTIKGLVGGITTIEATYSVMDFEEVSTRIDVYVKESNLMIHEMDIEVNGNIATLYDKHGEHSEKYLLYSEPLENDNYFEIDDNGVTKYLKLTNEYSDSLFAFEDVLTPTSGIQPKLIPRYNFRYDISNGIHFKRAYDTDGLIDTSIRELQNISKHFIFKEDPQSENIVEEDNYSDTWNGLTESMISKNGYVKQFEMSINKLNHEDSEQEIEIRKNITLHEFLHVLGFDDLDDEDQTRLNKNTILSYYRDKYLCNMLQPTETYTLADMYGFEMDVNDLNLGSGFKMSDKRIMPSDNDLTHVYSFSYDTIPDELLEEKSDIAIIGFVDRIETKKINIGKTKAIEYDVITLLVSEVIKGSVGDTINIKIPAGRFNMKLGENYEIYLKEYYNVPASPLNLRNAIKKL